jgi:hypothetical protein
VRDLKEREDRVRKVCEQTVDDGGRPNGLVRFPHDLVHGGRDGRYGGSAQHRDIALCSGGRRPWKIGGRDVQEPGMRRRGMAARTP